MIKAIFFDIDGTLVNNQSRVLPSTIQAIASAQSQGILCGVATGRGPKQLDSEIVRLNLDVFATYNGQYTYTATAVLRDVPFSLPVLQTVVSFGDQCDREILFGSNKELAGSFLLKLSQKKWAKRIARFLPSWFQSTALKDMMHHLAFHRKNQYYYRLQILQEPIYQCVLLSPISEKETLKERLPECQFTRSNPYTVDLLPLGGSKLAGIKAFAEKYDIKLEEIMAFGDSWNDCLMLQEVGIGVAMGNGENETKEAADFITKTNEEDGIYHALKTYRLIK